MKRIILLSLLSISALQAAVDLDAARTALADGFPQVAVKKLEQGFPGIESGGADSEATVLLSRALLDCGRPTESEALLMKGGKRLGRSGDFWLAQTLAALGRTKEALARYRACASDPAFSMARDASIGQARMLRNLGQANDAIPLLVAAFSWPESPVRKMALFDLAEVEIERKDVDAARKALTAISSEDPADRSRLDFLSAKCQALQGDDAGALKKFSAIVPLDGKMATDVIRWRAEAMVRAEQYLAAEAILEEFIAVRPTAPGLENLFAILDRIYSMGIPATSSEMKRWAGDNADSLRRKLARYYLARQESRENRPEIAMKVLEQTVQDDRMGNPVLSLARIELATIRLKEGSHDEALSLLPPAGESASADYLRGLALAAKGQPAEASAAFMSASSEPSFAESALFNSALCDLLSGANSRKAFLSLQERFPESRKIATFRLQEAFQLARARDPQAIGSLKKLEVQADSEVAGRAALALAGWKYQNGDISGARLDLQRASTHSDSDPALEAAMAVFLEDNGKSESDAAPIAAARKFLAEHAGSPPEPEVRMKLGELLYRKGDYASARVELESLARKFPGSSLEAPSLFLAAQATARLLTATTASEAMVLFEEVASMSSPLALRARFEQALLHNAQGRPKEAIVILDRILSSKPDAENKAAAQIEKGKTLYSVGLSDHSSYRAAIEVWKQLAADPEATPAARNQALARMGAAFEKLGDNDAAVACYYDALKAGQGKDPEFFWFYKAGFAAARILEASQKWSEAVKIYEMMATTNGPRSEEVRARINKIRLENFLWDGQ